MSLENSIFKYVWKKSYFFGIEFTSKNLTYYSRGINWQRTFPGVSKIFARRRQNWRWLSDMRRNIEEDVLFRRFLIVRREHKKVLFVRNYNFSERHQLKNTKNELSVINLALKISISKFMYLWRMRSKSLC